jgi:hypothetical protein
MASATAMTPPKSWGQFGWNLLDNALPAVIPGGGNLIALAGRIAQAGFAGTAPVHSPHPASQAAGGGNLATKSQSEISVRFKNMPPGARVSTHATGATVRIDTGKGMRTQEHADASGMNFGGGGTVDLAGDSFGGAAKILEGADAGFSDASFASPAVNGIFMRQTALDKPGAKIRLADSDSGSVPIAVPPPDEKPEDALARQEAPIPSEAVPKAILADENYNALVQKYGRDRVMTPWAEFVELRRRGVNATIDPTHTHVSVLEDSNGIPYTDKRPAKSDAKPVEVDFAALYQSLAYDAKGGPKAAKAIQLFFDKRIAIIPQKGEPAQRIGSLPYRSTFFDPGHVAPLEGESDPKVVDLNAGDPFGGLNAIYFNPLAAAVDGPDKGFISPALTLLHEIGHAVGFAVSPLGEWKMKVAKVPTSGPLKSNFEYVDEQRVEAGISSADVEAMMKARGMSPADIAAAEDVLKDFPEGTGLEKEAAETLGEYVRQSHYGSYRLVDTPLTADTKK